MYRDIPEKGGFPQNQAFVDFLWKMILSSVPAASRGKWETETDAMACASRTVFIL